MKLVLCVAIVAFACRGNQAAELTDLNKLFEKVFGTNSQTVSTYLLTASNGKLVDICGNTTQESTENLNSCFSYIEHLLNQLSRKSRTLLRSYIKEFCPNEDKFDRAALYVSYYDDEDFGVELFDKKKGFESSGKMLTFGEPYFHITDKAASYMFTIEDNVDINNTFISSNVTTYKRDPCDGKFRPSFTVDTNGDLYSLTLDENDEFIFTGDQDEGHVFVGLIQDEFFIQTDAFLPEGVSESLARPHMVAFHPTKKNLLGISYSGLDQVLFATFDGETGKLTSTGVSAKMAEGSFPQEFVFSKDTKFMYVTGHSTHKVTAFEVTQNDKEITAFKNIQELDTVPQSEFNNSQHMSKLAIHPSGNFLYVINMHFGSVAILKIDTTTGKLSLIDYQPTGGKGLTSIAVSPSGDQVVVADYDSDIVVVYNVDTETGKFTEAKKMTDVKKPGHISYPVIAPKKEEVKVEKPAVPKTEEDLGKGTRRKRSFGMRSLEKRSLENGFMEWDKSVKNLKKRSMENRLTKWDKTAKSLKKRSMKNVLMKRDKSVKLR